MRIVATSFIALALVCSLASAIIPSARADQDDTVEGEVNKKATQGKSKADDAKSKTAKAKAEARKEEQRARAEAAKAARKERLLKQEERRHEAQLKEIESRRARIENLYKRQMSNVDLAAAKEKERHDKRVAKIDAQ